MRRLLLVPLIALVALPAAGCGNKLDIRTQGDTEGLYIDVGPLSYQVQVSRYMNPSDIEDKAYLEGAPQGVAPGANEIWFGIFMRVQNYSKQTQTPTGDFEIHDTQGNVYRPVPMDAKVNPFAYVPQPIPAGDVFPPASSLASEGPVQQGSLILFKIKTESVQNRPLELRIVGTGNNVGIVDLDV